MSWWIWSIAGIYIIGIVLVFWFHIVFLQMVTPGLAMLRSAVWPIFLITGWPHGSPLPMD
jgi:hypothetical protein